MIKDSFWTDTYIENLDPTEKLLYIYILTNPLCNIAGIYQIQTRRIAFEIGIDKEMVGKLLNRLTEDGKIIRHKDWLLIINHAKHQSFKNPNVTAGIKRIIEDLPDEVKALKGFERLSHFTLLNLTLPNGDMWNKKTEDYEEGVIDIDGDGTLVEEKKPRTKKYPNAPTVRKIFLEVFGKNPASWSQHTVQLQACENLFTERGIEQIRSALEFYKENKDKEYCPVITSPYELDSKWSNLHTFKKRLWP